MQLSVNKRDAAARAASSGQETVPSRRLADLQQGEEATIERIDLPRDLAHRLMELGFLPGMKVTAAHSAPGGDPRVFQVDGSEIALRRETASRLSVKS
jgi:Fe2+ transport system protein FeoA